MTQVNYMYPRQDEPTHVDHLCDKCGEYHSPHFCPHESFEETLYFYGSEEHGMFKKGAFKKFFKKIGDALKKVGTAVEYAVLMPFKGAMENHLAKKGISHNGKLPDIAAKFHSSAVQGNSFENVESMDTEQFNLVDDVAAGIIKGILEFFKNIKRKKDSGQKLDPTEQALEADAETGVALVKQAAKEEVEETTADMISKYLFHSWVGPAMLGGIAILFTWLIIRR